MLAPQLINMEQVSELFLLASGTQLLPTTGYSSRNSSTEICRDLSPDIAITQEPQRLFEAGISLPQDLQMQFMGLRLMLDDFCTVEHLRECERALSQLQKLYCNICEDGNDVDITQVSWRWMAELSTAFVRLVEICYPPALVILAHFAMATITNITTTSTRLARQAWFMSGWGRYVLTGVSMTFIGSDWHRWIEWPLEMSRHEGSVGTRRILHRGYAVDTN